MTLRYGHDTNLAPLATLMGMNALQKETVDWNKIADTYRTYRLIPMCGNVQLIFYRKQGNQDILVKLLLNEREVTLPLRTDVSPYYHWNDVREYWKRVVKEFPFRKVRINNRICNMFVKRGICGLVLKVPLFIVMDIGCKCNTIEISMQYL